MAVATTTTTTRYDWLSNINFRPVASTVGLLWLEIIIPTPSKWSRSSATARRAMYKPRCTASTREKFFVDRIINVWNALPTTVNFTSVNVLFHWYILKHLHTFLLQSATRFVILSRKSSTILIDDSIVVHGSILCDPIRPNPSADWPNPTHCKLENLDPTQYN